jgi:hypothetical protein
MKFVVSTGGYMLESPTTFSIEADSLTELLMDYMEREDYDSDEDFAEENGLPFPFDENDLIDKFEDSNGDGQPYVTIFSVDDDKVVVGS